ncbi:hypothetical protein HanXRQr2_Chr12g0552001 [Helianthus annuus]|uniref:Uncharacterized protein n=1 Tax=Helianthus annuus TaxID=4232 RepID=A0A9K3HI56_HELAN|nr:hypothetical protein HanXRQr2_Chr12g0552001 [Helianthus annuus]
MDTSDTGDSDTTGPRPMESDESMSSEHEVHTSDFTSTDDDDFQPFALPDGVDEPIVGGPAADLPLAVIPAPIPLASYPAYELMLDAEAGDDIDLFDDELYEDEVPDPALLPAGGLLMIAGAPVGDSPVHSPAPDSFESVASAPSHVASTQLFVHDSDPDQASSAAPMPSFVFEHDDIEDSDPVFSPGFDPDRDIEFVHMDQPVEDPVDPADPFDPIDPDFDFDMAFDDPEPAVAPEQAAVFDPAHEHGLAHADVPVDPILAGQPLGDIPVDDIPLLDADHVDDPLVDPPIADVPVDPHVDHIDPVVAHVDPVLAPIPADEDVPPLPPHRTDAHHPEFSFQIPSVIPPAGPGEGSSAHPFGHVSMPMPVMPQISPVSASTSSFPVMPFGTASEPSFWSSLPVDPPHMGHTLEDLLMSFVHQHDSHSQRLQELERAQMPPCSGPSSSAAQPFRSFPPDIAARLSILEQQIASVIRTQQALEEDWLLFRRLHYPPPPPPF